MILLMQQNSVNSLSASYELRPFGVSTPAPASHTFLLNSQLCQIQPSRLLPVARGWRHQDMSDYGYPDLSRNNYKLNKIKALFNNETSEIFSGNAFNITDFNREIAQDPIEQPTLTSTPLANLAKKFRPATNPTVDFDHEEAKRLINDTNKAIHWLSEALLSDHKQPQEVDRVRGKIINIIDHYAGNYWLPLVLERFTAQDWNTLAKSASFNSDVAHFFSLITAHLCYNANTKDYFRIDNALNCMREAGIEIDALMVDTPKVKRCHLLARRNPTSPTATAESPVIGYFLRFCPVDIPQQHHYWILGLAGTQAATFRSNLKAHIRALVLNNMHWGYNEYYKNSIKPALTQRLNQLEACKGGITLPPKIHFAGHSLGGALAQFAARDFLTNDTLINGIEPVPLCIVHSNSSPRAGNLKLRQDLINRGAECISSNNKDDIVNKVPPNFLGFESIDDTTVYDNPVFETQDKLKILGKNWREGFVRHSLAVFLILFAPVPIRNLFIEKGLLLPVSNQYRALGYSMSVPLKNATQIV